MQNTTRTGTRVPAAIRDEIERCCRENAFDLPVLPRVALDVLAMCRSADADAREISKSLHADQGIAAHVLRIANSPLYGSTQRITSLQQAVSRLGLSQLVEVVVAISTKARVFEIPNEWRPLVGDLRRPALVAALFAKEIARLRRSNVESAFLDGLLHDVGKPVLLVLAHDLQARIGERFEPDEIAAMLEGHHTEVGSRLCASWGLSDSITTAVRHQHDWASLSEPPDGAPLIALATRATSLALGAESANGIELLRDHPALPLLDLYQDEIASLWGMRDALVETAEAMA